MNRGVEHVGRSYDAAAIELEGLRFSDRGRWWRSIISPSGYAADVLLRHASNFNKLEGAQKIITAWPNLVPDGAARAEIKAVSDALISVINRSLSKYRNDLNQLSQETVGDRQLDLGALNRELFFQIEVSQRAYIISRVYEIEGRLTPWPIPFMRPPIQGRVETLAKCTRLVDQIVSASTAICQEMRERTVAGKNGKQCQIMFIKGVTRALEGAESGSLNELHDVLQRQRDRIANYLNAMHEFNKILDETKPLSVGVSCVYENIRTQGGAVIGTWLKGPDVLNPQLGAFSNWGYIRGGTAKLAFWKNDDEVRFKCFSDILGIASEFNKLAQPIEPSAWLALRKIPRQNYIRQLKDENWTEAVQILAEIAKIELGHPLQRNSPLRYEDSSRAIVSDYKEAVKQLEPLIRAKKPREIIDCVANILATRYRKNSVGITWARHKFWPRQPIPSHTATR